MHNAAAASPLDTGYALGGRLGGGSLVAAAPPEAQPLDLVPIDLAHADWLEQLWDLPDLPGDLPDPAMHTATHSPTGNASAAYHPLLPPPPPPGAASPW